VGSVHGTDWIKYDGSTKSIKVFNFPIMISLQFYKDKSGIYVGWEPVLKVCLCVTRTEPFLKRMMSLHSA